MNLPATCSTATNPIIPALFKSEHGPAINPQTLHSVAYRLITADSVAMHAAPFLK